ncbi:hypothetical protein KUV39_08700 [Phaeobacter italicus]|uniref:hypothetical protein n=1 Tax=Phaeobacter italicus TaxID=481446 RepID=UPI001C9675D1|nr:hypothetical protein [Phaeobacter italicus]MBY5976724.1 hypothetical protein [Phaeobacter italicus]
MEEYEVMRRHQGDKFYEEGETREAKPSDVSHLVARGVLRKKAPEVLNKVRAVPKSKARGK